MNPPKSVLNAIISACFVFAAAMPSAFAGLLSYQDETTGGILQDLDPVTAVASNSRSTLSGLVGIEFDASGKLYGLSSLNNSLFSINPSTGAGTLIGATGLNLILEGDLAFDPTTGRLWGAYQLATLNLDFFTLDTVTGAATFAFSLTSSFADYSAMAFDSAGNLFILNTQSTIQDSLLVVDKTTGAILDELLLTDSGNAANLGGRAGMDFDPLTGNMYVTDSGTKVLYTLNTSTGALSFISISTVGNTLAGLAVVPQLVSVPEPATLLLLAGGLAWLGGLSRRRR